MLVFIERKFTKKRMKETKNEERMALAELLVFNVFFQNMTYLSHQYSPSFPLTML